MSTKETARWINFIWEKVTIHRSMLSSEWACDLRWLESHVKLLDVIDVAARALGKTDKQYKTNSISWVMSGLHAGMNHNASFFGHFNSSFEHWSTMNDPEKNIIAVRVVPIIFMVIFVTGIFGNALVVYVFIRNKAFRTVTNMFLLNLALVDLVYLCFCCPFTTVKVLVMYWPFGNVMCK